MKANPNVDAAGLRALTRRLLVAAGTPQHVGEVVADVLVEANLTGHDSHGVLRIPTYLEQIASGRIRPAAEPQVLGETGTVIRLDGQNASVTTPPTRAWARRSARPGSPPSAP